MFVTTRQVVLLNLSSFSSSAERKFTVLIRSSLCYKVLSMYTSQRRLVQSRLVIRLKVDRGFDRSIDGTIQEVEPEVLPLPKLRFIYIIEVAFKLLFGLRNPKTTVLGMTPYDAIVQ